MSNRTYEDDYDHPIVATRIDLNYEIHVRKMDKDEMPDDGITYYADTDCTIYQENELTLSNNLSKGDGDE